jgi:hypothetical protein
MGYNTSIHTAPQVGGISDTVRAIPATIFAFFAAAAIVSFVRWLQLGAENYTYNPQVTLVLAPFLMVFAFIWGMGGLDPRMSEHAHGPQESPLEGVAIVPVAESHDDHHDPYEEEAKRNPLSILSGQIWTIGTVVLVVILGLLAFAQLPTGLRLDTTADPMASASSNATNATFALPLGLGEFHADKLAVFLGFIAFTMISLLVVAGLLGLLFYSLNQGVATVKTVRTTSIDDPENDATFAGRAAHAPLRGTRRLLNWVGHGSGAVARGLRRGLPRFFGQR